MRLTTCFTFSFLFGQLLVAQPPPGLLDQRVAKAEKQIAANPKLFQPYNELASALLRKGRDSEDVTVFRRAEAAADESLKLSPANYEAQKLKIAALTGEHQWAAALKMAVEINHKVPDDIAGWALLVDLNSALGNYVEAERDAQWILDLRPGSALGFEKAAGLRELFGDFEGASDFFNETKRRTSMNDLDQQAWLSLQQGRMELGAGNIDRAQGYLAEATKQFPDSQLALGVLAQIKTAQGAMEEAARLLEQRYQATKTPANLFDWAQALERAGEKEKARSAFQTFETAALAETAQPYNANLQLIYYDADHKGDSAAALALAQREIALRHDSATTEAYAWALYNSGEYAEAKAQMDKALAVGVKNAVYQKHQAMISAKLQASASGASK